ncbi:MAG: alpha-ketoglutarate-dependent dioxygenase AlkB [Cytophagales bacterium]|nr:MAG: alpha-ketoglutarate-dependent dioxygenase AlkB [Cytophagales bacterium]
MQSSLFPNQTENLLPFQGEMYLFPDFFTKKQADHFFAKLSASLEWRQEPIWMFGKRVMQPRLTALYGDPEKPYGYSGIQMTPSGWTPELRHILDSIQDFSQAEFTHVLCNYYRDGNDSMGWHRDNEKVLGENPTIASVTFGAERIFQTRPYSEKRPKLDISLTHGSLLLMTGESQHFWEHQLPKTKKVNQARINLTFRKLL